MSTNQPERGRKLTSILVSALFAVIAPGTVAGWIPYWISRWRFEPPFFRLTALRYLGAIFVAAGLLTLLETFSRFALQGLGSPAPVYPAQRLVVTGLYRYVRNPMYVGVLSAIFGQALLFGNATLLGYAALIWAAFFVFVLVYEEPTLKASFGSEYEGYCAHVPRWVPRLTPWTGASKT